MCTSVKLLEDLVSRCKENLSLGLSFLLFALPFPYTLLSCKGPWVILEIP